MTQERQILSTETMQRTQISGVNAHVDTRNSAKPAYWMGNWGTDGDVI